MNKHLIKNKKEYISAGIIFICTLLILTYLLKLWNLDIHTPLAYYGGDDMSQLANVRMVREEPWIFTISRLGAPYTAQYYDFPANFMHNFDILTLKVIALIFKDVAVSSNVLYFSIFFLIAFISYFTMRQLKITNWISICGSLVFTFLPYAFMRGISHLVLTTYYFVPLSILLCIWIYEDDSVLNFNKSFFKNKKNWAIIIFTLLIANNGIAYYPFFTCYLLGVTAISKWIKTGKIKSILKSVSVIGMICFYVVLNLIPIIINHIRIGSNPEALQRAGVGEAEIYGLKIIQLFLPVNGHRTFIQDIIDEYNQLAPWVTENRMAYIGIMGIIGFIILLFVVFNKKENRFLNRMTVISELNIGMVLLGTVGGFSAVISLLITDMLRSYNRISVFIGYICILAFCLVLNEIYLKYKKKLIIVMGICFSLFCIWEQFPMGYTPSYDMLYASYTEDKEFIEEIENSVQAGSMIYQLPYHSYPEGGTVNNMEDYHLYAGYIHSDTLKWSYGSMKGREGDLWNRKVSTMDISDMIKYLKENDFAGIYIDRRAYTETEIIELENEIKKGLETDGIYSSSNKLSFFNFGK